MLGIIDCARKKEVQLTYSFVSVVVLLYLNLVMRGFIISRYQNLIFILYTKTTKDNSILQHHAL